MPPILAFCDNPLDRTSTETDPGALARALRDPGTLGLVFAGDDPVLSRETGGTTSAFAPLGSRLGGFAAAHGVERACLGLLDGRAVVVTEVPAACATDLADDPGLRVVDLRTIATGGLVPGHELGVLAQAKALLHWHRTHGFCARCGHATVPSDSRLRRDCAHCGTQHFPRTDPVVIMLVTRGDSCLLGRQARFAPLSYSCLAGFVSQGETLEDAVRREVLEEAGIRVGPVRYLHSQPWPFPSSLMIGCHGEALTDKITIDREELEDARWFTRAEIVRMLAATHPDGLVAPHPIAIARHLLTRWMAGD